MIDNLALLVLRLSIGLVMACAHGWPKLANFTAKMNLFPDPLGIGSQLSLGLVTFAELFCSIALILGLKTRWATVPLIITMLVAFFGMHLNDPWPNQERVILFIIPYVTLLFLGGGKYGLDSILGRK